MSVTNVSYFDNKNVIPKPEMLVGYLTECAKVLHMTEYHFEVELKVPQDDDDDYWAAIDIPEESFTAEITFNPKLFTKDADFIRWTICHELLHTLTTPILEAVEDIFKPMAPPAMWDGLIYAVDKRHERMTDRIALLLAPLLPEFKFESSPNPVRPSI